VVYDPARLRESTGSGSESARGSRASCSGYTISNVPSFIVESALWMCLNCLLPSLTLFRTSWIVFSVFLWLRRMQ